MMKTYSHIRRQALNEAAAALEPNKAATPIPPEQPPTTRARVQEKRVMFGTADSERSEELRFTKTTWGVNFAEREIGSSGWTRTNNPPVNSRMLCH